MIQLDDYIFQMGWFNQQLVIFVAQKKSGAKQPEKENILGGGEYSVFVRHFQPMFGVSFEP